MRVWSPIETSPNDVFDVLAKYWDASLDKFMYRRFQDCVEVAGKYYTPLLKEGVSLTDAGFKPTHWMAIPDFPDDIER